jgi:hypothetical protein
MDMRTTIYVPAPLIGSASNDLKPGEDDSSAGIHIDLWIRDTEVVAAIGAHPEGRPRDDYVRTAIKIGVLALQQAHGLIDGETVRNEGERLIAILETRLGLYQTQIRSILSDTLKDYFDPGNGRFNERVERLIKHDGDLERVMRAQMDAAATTLKQSLENQVGPRSSFAQLLTPDESNALLAAIRKSVDDLVSTQRDKVLSEFSLDNQNSALSRLLPELATHHGRMTGDLKESIATIVSEFSLDKEDSALSRLVKRVEVTQRQISAEFTLDEEGSALSRMRRDLTASIETMRRKVRSFSRPWSLRYKAASAPGGIARLHSTRERF